MKKVILAFLIMSHAVPMHAQVITDSTKIEKIDTTTSLRVDSTQLGLKYLKKSNTQQTVGTILFCTGSVSALIGSIIVLNQLSHWGDHSQVSNIDEVLGYTGLVLMISSAPFFILSRTNKRKAQVYLGNQHAFVTPKIMMASFVSAGLKISL